MESRFVLCSQSLAGMAPPGLPASVGGLVTFEGLVREHNEGKTVVALEYSAYPSLAAREGQRIVDEASARFELQAAVCAHRTGRLRLGEAAVRVWAAAAHRGEAFAGCEYIIHEVKVRLPIWKKETYLDGSQAWVACHHAALATAP